MDYEKAYKTVIEKAENVLLDCTSSERCVVEYLFPELKESEDEKIRKDILELIKQHTSCGTRIKMEAWLEKQGEQKPTADLKTWRNIVDEVLTRFVGIGQYLDSSRATAIAKDLQKKYSLEQSANITDDWIEDYWQHEKINNPDSYDKGDEIQFDHQGFVNFCRKYCQKHAEWSEEDERIYRTIIHDAVESTMALSNTQKRWLKSLKPQNKWKPTPSQLSALEEASNDYTLSCEELARLSELYEQLKKL